MPTSTDTTAIAVSEVLATLKEWEKWAFEWSGSAFIAGEETRQLDDQRKAQLYGDLCSLGNHMLWLHDQIATLTAALPHTRQAAEPVAKMLDQHDALLERWTERRLAPPASPAQQEPVAWTVEVSESDGRTFLTLKMANGTSASLSCKTRTDNSETLASQVVKGFARDFGHASATHHEPVAWRYKDEGSGIWHYVEGYEPVRREHREPLYTSPPASPAPDMRAEAVDWQRVDDALVGCAGLLKTLCRDEIGDKAAEELEYVRSSLARLHTRGDASHG